MDNRAAKARELASRGRVVRDGLTWLVFSLNSGNRYRVALDPVNCSCEDFSLRQEPCKHVIAARITAENGTPVDRPAVLMPPQRWPRKSHPQPNWSAYNSAKANEKDEFLPLLADLCSRIPEPKRQGRGRPSLPLADRVFAATVKVFGGMSSRRSSCDLRAAHEAGYLSQPPHYNSVLRYLESPELIPIITSLISESALPLRTLETDFAIDSTGFSGSRFARWYDHRWGRERSELVWVKAHALCGTRTHVITAAEVPEGESHDAPNLPPLVKATAAGFKIERLTGDVAYATVDNFQATADAGGTLFTTFRTNATGAAGGLYGKMYHLFCLNKEDYLRRYHKRSNIESVFSAVKRVFGDAVRSKTITAMRNEVLCKMLCHNICCLIEAMYVLGVEVNFGAETEDASKMILKFPY